MTLTPQTQRWPADRAILFVHGIGNAGVGDYSLLVEQVHALLGDDAKRFAFYFLYYDEINDWFAAKLQAGALIEKLIGGVRSQFSQSNGAAPAASIGLGNAVAEFAGDVLWPVLLADARTAIRAMYLNQLRRIVRDGEDAKVPARRQHVTIIAHSMGCFHTYEALGEAAADKGQGLSPATWGVRFDNVIYMASPVQLIRTVARDIQGVVPSKETLHCASGSALALPSEASVSGVPITSARRTVSITGNLDPVGGHLMRTRLPWAYMDFPDQATFEPYIDQQQVATTGSGEDLTLAGLLEAALRDGAAPNITPENPHDWSAYIARHAEQLKAWLTA
jgi:hypothetical protein